MPANDAPQAASWVSAPVPSAPKVQSASQELFASPFLKDCAAICKHVYDAAKPANQAVLAAAGVRTITDGPVIDQLRADNRFEVDANGSITNKKNGLKVSIYQDSSGNFTVGIAGTAMGLNSRARTTWANNIKGGAGAIPSHDKQAREIVQMCQFAYGPNAVSVTGHSAGGRAAAYAALVTGARALTINADGLGPGYQKNPYIGPKINGPEGRAIIQVRTNHDELGIALKALNNKLPGSDVNMIGTRGKLGHSMGSVLKSIQNPLPNRAELVQKERQQGADVSAEMTEAQAEDLRAFAVMAKDVYNPTKVENMQQRAQAGLVRLGPEQLKQLPGLRAKMENAGWKVDLEGTITQKKTGLKAALYQQRDGKIGVSIAGTEAHLNQRMPKTWLNNAKAAVGFNCQHDKEARDLAMMAQDAFGKDRVTVVGHSAGGRAAAYAALQAHAPGVTFNADGLGPRYRLNRDVAKKLNALDAQNITQVRTKQDWLKPIVDRGLSKLPGSTIIMAGDGGHGMRAVLNAMEGRQADAHNLRRTPGLAAAGFSPPAVLPPSSFTLSANTDKSAAQASETYAMKAQEGQVLGGKGELRAFAKPQFDPSSFAGLKLQQESATTAMSQIARTSQAYNEWNSLNGQLANLEVDLAKAQQELAKTQVKLAEIEVSGTEDQKAAWRRALDTDQQALDKLLDFQARTDEFEAQLDQLAQHPDVVQYLEHQATLLETNAAIKPMADVANASSPLFHNSVEMNDNAALGGDRSLLARSVATYQVDQLLGTNVIAEEKIAQAPPPDGRIMGVSVQVDGAQVTGKYQGKDCYLKMDYSDPRVQQGMADLEALDYITGQIDRHNGNIFVNPETGKVTGIDNDLAFPERNRAAVLATDPALREKAVENMPARVSAAAADKILAIHPDQLTATLQGIKNPDGSPGLSKDEIAGAVQRLEELQAAIKNPASGVQVIKEFNQQTYEAAIHEQRQKLAEQTGLDEIAQPRPDFNDIDSSSVVKGAHKASYLGAAVAVGRKYELLQGQIEDGVEFGIRDGKTANVKAQVDPVFAEFKQQEQAAKQALAANPVQIENLAVKREVQQFQAQLKGLQGQLNECQKKLDKLEAPLSLAERAKARLHIGPSRDEKHQEIAQQKQEILQGIKAVQLQMDASLNEAVQPLRTQLLEAAYVQVAEKQALAQQQAESTAMKQDMLRDLADQYGIDPKMLEIEGPDGQARTFKQISDVAANKEINANSFRERADDMLQNSPAESKLAYLKADRDQAVGLAIRQVAEALRPHSADITPEQMASIAQAFEAVKDLSDKHDQEESVQNEQRLELYTQEVAAAVTPVLAQQGFTPQEIEVFTEAAVKLGMEAESAALKNNSKTAKLFAGQLKDGLEKSGFTYSDHNPAASKIHDALYRANNTNAHVHLDGDVEIKRGHASFQEKTANKILADVAAEKGVELAPVDKTVQQVDNNALPELDANENENAVQAPEVEVAQQQQQPAKKSPSVAEMLGRHRANVAAGPAAKVQQPAEPGKVNVRASLSAAKPGEEAAGGPAVKAAGPSKKMV